MPRRLSLTLCLVLLVFSAAPVDADVTSLIGQPAPEIRARPLTSDALFSLESHRGRVVLLAFVASWCRACERMVPELEALGREHEGELDVLALSHERRAPLLAHAERVDWGFPLLQCSGRTAVNYHARALPTLVLIDRRGVVRAAHQGATEETTRRLRRDVAELVRTNASP